MILYPALELRDGHSLRRLSGDDPVEGAAGHDDGADEPAAQAGRFAAAGCRWLHVVARDSRSAEPSGDGDGRGPYSGDDLDSDPSGNWPAVRAILQAARAGGAAVQITGALGGVKRFAGWLEAGAARLVLGPAVLARPEAVRQACRDFPGAVAVSLEARDGMSEAAGWTAKPRVRAVDMALRLEEAGVAAIIYTDINRAGAVARLNLEAIVDLAWALTTPVIAAGGITGLDELAALQAEEAAGIEGVIVGRALYDGRIPLRQALAMMAARTAD
ncbi:MAG: HisA/HisF-related TIM barrel protein [Alphaproteobacteria bacterium]